MAKTTVIRTNRLFTMYKRVARRKGRGSNFQWNAKSVYVIMGPDSDRLNGKSGKVFKTFEEADKEWVYLTLKH